MIPSRARSLEPKVRTWCDVEPIYTDATPFTAISRGVNASALQWKRSRGDTARVRVADVGSRFLGSPLTGAAPDTRLAFQPVTFTEQADLSNACFDGSVSRPCPNLLKPLHDNFL